jgi:hypothetical protein
MQETLARVLRSQHAGQGFLHHHAKSSGDSTFTCIAWP